MAKIPVLLAALLVVIFISLIAVWMSYHQTPTTNLGRMSKRHAFKADETGGGGGKGANAEAHLLQDVRKLDNVMKLMDDKIVELSERIKIEDPTPPPAIPRAPRQIFPSSDEDGESIFVSVASFRDVECGPMILDLFKKAESPKKIHVGIVEQHAPEDNPCLPVDFIKNCQHDVFCPTDNIRVRKIEPREAKGPTFGRYVSMLLYRGERYLMMIDSHNRFVQHWDTKVIGMHRSLDDPKAVLSHYPEAYTEGMELNRATTSYLCRASWFNHHLKFEGVVVGVQDDPMPQPYAAAGFVFADAKVLHEVPFDPHLPFLFDGEEILYSIRMWTSGYNIYSPSSNVLYHFYGRPSAPKVWGEKGVQWPNLQRKSIERVQYFLRSVDENRKFLVADDTTDKDITVEEEKYGLGSVRSLDEYYKFAGINPMTRTFDKNWCSLAK